MWSPHSMWHIVVRYMRRMYAAIGNAQQQSMSFSTAAVMTHGCRAVRFNLLLGRCHFWQISCINTADSALKRCQSGKASGLAKQCCKSIALLTN